MLGDPIYNKLVYTPVSGTEEALAGWAELILFLMFRLRAVLTV